MKWKLLLFLSLCVSHLPAFSQKNDTETQEIAESDTIKKVRYAAIPIVNYSRTFGLIGGAMGQAFYKVNKKDTISPSSSTMVMGFYSSSKTYMGLFVQNLYFNEDKWRMKYIGGLGNIAFQYYQTIPTLPPSFGQDNIDGIWIDYTTSVKFFNATVQRKIIEDLYGGIDISLSWATTEFDIENPATGEKLTDESTMHAVGYNLAYDSRDHVNFPTKGWFVNYKNFFYRELWGATNNFEKFELSANYFWDIKENSRSILVSRVFADIGTGDVPFQGEGFIGRDDLRGYSQGEFRGKQVYAIQCELRQNIYKKFGMIGFLGVGSATENLSEISDSDIVPSIGLGVRYLMIEKEKINVGFDFGVGRDDWSLAFRIGETFGR